MTARRGAGEGSVYREERTLADGTVRFSWVGTADVGRDPATGRRTRVKVKGRTKAEVLRRLTDARRQAAEGLDSGGAARKLGPYLDDWLATVVANRVGSDLTVANYRQTVRLHIVPALGDVPVGKLTPEMVDRWLLAKADRYSKNYVTRMRSVLADALTHAERRGIVSRNAARLAVLPKCQPTPERRSLTSEEAGRLLEAAAGERLGALLTVGLMLGLRPGELTGLMWSDLDLDADPATLSVTGSAKVRPDGSVYRGAVKRSTSGRRTLALPDPAAAALRAHRKAQAAERLKAGPGCWSETGLVFTSEVGTMLDPSNVRRTFRRVATRAGLDPGFPYLLRHTAASLLIDAGVPVEQVADLLGDDPRTLYRFYRHRVRPVVDAASAMPAILSRKG